MRVVAADDAEGRGGLPVIPVGVTPETEPFWTAAAEGRLLLERCRSCGTVIWYPKPVCPSCHGRDLEWFEGSGRGTIYSFTVVRRGGYASGGDHVLAYVELEEGPRVMTNIVVADPSTLACDQPVEAVFHDTGHGSALLRFEPAAGS